MLAGSWEQAKRRTASAQQLLRDYWQVHFRDDYVDNLERVRERERERERELLAPKHILDPNKLATTTKTDPTVAKAKPNRLGLSKFDFNSSTRLIETLSSSCNHHKLNELFNAETILKI